ncbi:MAG: PEGA domain-containing protein [Oceanidesulfovibrio sp.]
MHRRLLAFVIALLLLFPAYAHAVRELTGSRTATLYVDTEPENAQVRLLEIKPKFKQGIALPAGKYVIDVRSKGYITQYKQFRLQNGQTLRLKVSLERDPAVPLPEDAGPDPNAPGALFVDIEPADAEIRILNVQPKFKQGIELPPRTYSLDSTREGYETTVFTAVIEPGKETRVSVAMEPTGRPAGQNASADNANAEGPRGTLIVEMSPADAQIAIDELNEPYIPGMRLPPGDYTVTATRKGYTPLRKRVTIRPDANTTTRVVLASSLGKQETPDALPAPENTGILTARIEPQDATLTLHGSEMPFSQGMFLEQGEYTLEARRPGYEARNATFHITPGSETVVELRLAENEEAPPPASSLLSETPVKLVSEQQIEGGDSTGKLFLKTEPADAEILILNIKPKFEQGMELPPGKYRIEVRADGYMARRVRVEVSKALASTYLVSLEPSVPQATTLQKSPPEKARQAEALLEQAQDFARNEQKQTALEKASEAVSLDPTNPQAFRIRGSILRALKKFELAVADYNCAIQLAENEPLFYVERAVTLVEMGNVDGACYDFWKACALGQCKPITMARTEGVCP